MRLAILIWVFSLFYYSSYYALSTLPKGISAIADSSRIWVTETSASLWFCQKNIRWTVIFYSFNPYRIIRNWDSLLFCLAPSKNSSFSEAKSLSEPCFFATRNVLHSVRASFLLSDVSDRKIKFFLWILYCMDILESVVQVTSCGWPFLHWLVY